MPCTIARYRRTGRSKLLPLKGDKLGIELRDPVDKALDQLLLASLAAVRRADRIDRPPVPLAMRDEGPDADDGVIDVLLELVAHHLANFGVRLADEIIGGCESLKVRDRLDIPDDGMPTHAP